MWDDHISYNNSRDIRTLQKHDSITKNNLNTSAISHKDGWPQVSQFVPAKLLQSNIIRQYTYPLVWEELHLIPLFMTKVQLSIIKHVMDAPLVIWDMPSKVLFSCWGPKHHFWIWKSPYIWNIKRYVYNT